jgi:hypothetical protein
MILEIDGQIDVDAGGGERAVMSNCSMMAEGKPRE